MSKMVQRRYAVLTLAAAATLVGAVQSTSAQSTGTWNVDASGPWGTTSNWTGLTGGAVPNAVGATVSITNNIVGTRTITLDADRTLGNLLLGDSTSSYFSFIIAPVSGASPPVQLVFDQTGVANASLSIPNVGGVATSPNSISANVLLNDNLEINTSYNGVATAQLAFNGVVTDGAGSFGLIKNGSGVIQLAGLNTYDGGTTVNGGKINVLTGTSLGTGTVTINSGGQVVMTSGGAIVNNLSVSGSGYVTAGVDSAAQLGALVLDGKAALGTVTVAGAARIGSASKIGYIVGGLSGSAALDINGTATTTGGVLLQGSGASYTGNLSLARGSFEWTSSLGGNVAVTTATTTVLSGGTTLAGSLTLDNSAGGTSIYRNIHGPLSVGSNFSATGATTVQLVNLGVPGSSQATLFTVGGTISGAGSLVLGSGYRGTPSITSDPTTIMVTGLNTQTVTWAGPSGGAWDAQTSSNWLSTDGKFGHGDAVVFTDTGAGTLTNNATVSPYAITFNNTTASAYTLNSSAANFLDGVAGGLSVQGGGTVTLAGTSNFEGAVSISSGRLIVGSVGALGYSSGISVTSGGALDLNGKALYGLGGRIYSVSIAGTGNDGTGAIINSGGILFTATPTSGIRVLTLTANASIGGTGSYEVGGNGSIEGGGFTLTKIGSNTVYLAGPANNVTMVVQGGVLSSFAPGSFGTALTVKNNATADLASSGTYATPVTIESGGVLSASAGTEDIWSGAITALGNVSLFNASAAANMIVAQGFSIPGTLSMTGAAPVTLLGTVSVSGGTTLSNGTLNLGNGGTTGMISATSIITSGTLPLLVINRSDNVAFSSNVTGNGRLQVKGTGKVTLLGSNSYSGSTTISAGVLEIGNGGTTGTLGTGTVSNSSLLTFNRSDAYGLGSVISGTGSVGQVGAGTTTLSGSSTYSGSTFVTGGMLAISGVYAPVVASTTTLTITSPGRAAVSGTASFYSVSSPNSDLLIDGALNIKSSSPADVSTIQKVTGNGSLSLDKGTLIAGAGFQNSALSLTNGAIATVSVTDADGAGPGTQGSNDGVSKLNTLSVDTTSRLDLKNNALILPATATFNGSAITVNTLRSALIAGRGSVGTGGATWSGNGGIGSSSFTLESANSLGYVWNADPNLLILGGITSVNGVAPASTDYAVKFTRAGDANLDGIVDNIDVGIIGLRYLSTLGNQWYQGDFNYDGVVNNDDVAILGLAYAPSASPLSPGYRAPLAESFSATANVVPEPTSLGLLAVGAMQILRRRRR